MMANREGPEGLTLAASSKAVWWHLVTLIDMRTCSLYKDTSLKQYSIITLPSMYSNSAGLFTKIVLTKIKQYKKATVGIILLVNRVKSYQNKIKTLLIVLLRVTF